MKNLNLTKNEQKIVNFLADTPWQNFFTTEIAKKTKISLGGCFNALNSLLKKNMIKDEARGNMKFWQINAESALVKQYRVAFLLDKIKNFIKTARPQANGLILFGSGARGEYDKTSDIDLLILANDKQAIKSIINKYAKKYLIKSIIKTLNEWHELEIKEPEFYQEIKRGIEL